MNTIRKMLDHVSDSLVRYELECRGQDIKYSTMRTRKMMLLKILDQESKSEHPVDIKPVLSPSNDIAQCTKMLNFFEEEFDLQKHTTDVIEALSCKMDFLKIRIDRITPTDDVEKNALSSLKTKFDDVQLKVTNISVTSEESSDPNFSSSVNSNPSILSSTANRPTNAFREEPRASTSSLNELKSKVPVWKWNVKFTGDSKGQTASDFVRKVSDLAKSRNISHDELFISAIELFDGIALKWFQSVATSETITTWKSLCEKLIADFESPLYADDLLDTIKARKQSSTESIVVFFATIENLFLKLTTNLDSAEKIKILRRNILPEYSRNLALHDFKTVDDLKNACKTLELTFKESNRGRQRQDRIEPRSVNMIEQQPREEERPRDRANFDTNRFRENRYTRRQYNYRDWDTRRNQQQTYHPSNSWQRNERSNNQQGHRRSTWQNSNRGNNPNRHVHFEHTQRNISHPENEVGVEVGGPDATPMDRSGPESFQDIPNNQANN